MDISIYSILETTGAAAITVALVAAFKQAGINPKFLPLLSLLIGIGVVWAGSLAGLLPVQGGEFVWYGIVTGIIATGGFSGVKNITQGIKGEI